jgi:tetratricopeptide (TPR) repeat protein
VVEALSLPLAGSVAPPTPDVPQNPLAYELYLRANEVARTYDGLTQARDLYLRALELDPRFAPAWAHLGRCLRVIGKYVDDVPDSDAKAEDAFKRALALDPRLSVAHKFYAQLEADTGQSQHAVVRLLGEAARHGNDPELFAGLVHGCRYCGLYEESLRAHLEARRLDPNVTTSVEGTLLLMAHVDRLVTLQRPAIAAGADEGIRVMGLGLAGRRAEALEALAQMRHAPIPAFETWIQFLKAWLEGRPKNMLDLLSTMGVLKIQEDPEAMFVQGWMLCDAGEHAAGLAYLERAVARGYYAAPTLTGGRQFDGLRRSSDFQALVAQAETGRRQALAAFREAGGERLLGTWAE